ncbi:MAG: histidine phosphatase family protein [Acidobacteriales bacterium]|nr:histidine phosphatase family protein [Terriglobales bacterium]
MSVLTVVRHGQASFLAEDYDKLSSIGERQAAALGEYWARNRVKIDAVYTGPKKRQIDTATIAGAAYTGAGLHWPVPVVLKGLDEYRVDEVMRRYVPDLAAADRRVGELRRAVQKAKGTPALPIAIEKLFRRVSTMWVQKDFDARDVEDWSQFSSRAREALAETRNHGRRGAHVVVVTSAGPTAVALQTALGLDDVATLELSWLVRNTACSEFLFSGNRFSLWSFNTTPHLSDATMITYR